MEAILYNFYELYPYLYPLGGIMLLYCKTQHQGKFLKAKRHISPNKVLVMALQKPRAPGGGCSCRCRAGTGKFKSPH